MWPRVLGRRRGVLAGSARGGGRDVGSPIGTDPPFARLAASWETASVMTYQDHLVRDPAICAGQPVVRGTRVLVRSILGYLAHGDSTETILREFPSLTEADVRAVISFAASSAAEDLPAPSPLPPEVKVA